jgi:hypothetical protein
MADNYDSLTVKQLKDVAKPKKDLELKSSLRKAEIIEKLREWDQEHATKSAIDAEEQAVDTVPATEEPDTTNNGDLPDAPGVEAVVEDDPTPQPTTLEVTPPAIENVPKEVSALSEPETEPTPPPHHATIQPGDLTDAPIPSKELDEPAQDPVPSSDSTHASTKDAAAAQSIIDTLPSSDTSLAPADIVEDNLKRKRRSLTPARDEEEVEAKRPKLSNTIDNDVSFLKEAEVDSKAESKDPEPINKDMRRLFKGDAVPQPSPEPLSEALFSAEASVEPARHLATRGIYIANLKRPLQEPALRKHLEKLAAPQSSAGEDESQIEVLYLDQIKTHALVLFRSIAAASRVRAALHDRKFPEEANRDPLFVDFFPEDKVTEWIEKEKNADGSGRTGGIRWHVVYVPNGGVVHEEVGPTSRAPPKGPRNPSFSAAAPLAGPSASRYPPSGPAPPQRPSGANAASLPPRQKASFQALEERFDKTKSKPMLYYKRVDPKLAASRLEELRYLTAQDWSGDRRRMDEEMFRYHFEQGDKLVSTGLSRGSQHHARKEYQLEQKFKEDMATEARDGGGAGRRGSSSGK